MNQIKNFVFELKCDGFCFFNLDHFYPDPYDHYHHYYHYHHQYLDPKIYIVEMKIINSAQKQKQVSRQKKIRLRVKVNNLNDTESEKSNKLLQLKKLRQLKIDQYNKVNNYYIKRSLDSIAIQHPYLFKVIVTDINLYEDVFLL